MSSHPNRVPDLGVWHCDEGVWRWRCWAEDCDLEMRRINLDRDCPTHAEALAAALAHCAKATS